MAVPADVAVYEDVPEAVVTVAGDVVFSAVTNLTVDDAVKDWAKNYPAAYAKGLGDRQVLYGHIFRNAMMIVIAGIPAAFIGILFTGSMLIEIIFNLDGLGLLGYEAAVSRDYPVMFGTLYFFTLLGLIIN
ncbi:ABC transporter permease subunit, partial [bacterium]|nr:ABC transporter permease subunit [bacterium]